MDAITTAGLENKTLEECEAMVDDGVGVIRGVAVGVDVVLTHMKATGLYKKTNSRWGDYTLERFGFTGRWANKLIEAPKKQENPKKNRPDDTKNANNGNTVPDDDPSSQGESEEVEQEEQAEEIVVHLDQTKRQIPANLVNFFQETDAQIKPLKAAIDQVVAIMKEMTESNTDPIWKRLNYSEFKTHIRNIREQIKFCRPWAWCPICKGGGKLKNKKCPTCKGPGWLIKLGWKAVSEDQK